MSVKHAKTAVGVDSGLTKRLDPSDWNAEHIIDGLVPTNPPEGKKRILNLWYDPNTGELSFQVED